MRHANYATTLRFYTMLTGEDAAKAVAQLPAPVAEEKRAEAGGAPRDEPKAAPAPAPDPQQYPQQLEAGMDLSCAG